MRALLLVLLMFVTACAPGTTSPPATQTVIGVFATPASRPWLEKFYPCAAKQQVALALTDLASAQLILRLGEPEGLSQPAFQIGEEQIEVVVPAGSPLRDLGREEVRALFVGQGQENVQVWVFSPASDVQQVFDRQLMGGQGITSLARLASGPEEMAEALSAQVNAIGLLPGRLVPPRGVRGVWILPGVPVIVIAAAPVEGGIQNFLACLQAE
ncbi:MAG: hypothetical protein ACP5QU_08915 [Anaerolineae bacterium]